MGEWDKSEQYYKEALSIPQRLNEFQQIGQSYYLLGWLHFEKGEYAKAREFYEEMSKVYEKAGAKYPRILYSQWVVWTYIELGEIEKAKNVLKIFASFLKSRRCKAFVILNFFFFSPTNNKATGTIKPPSARALASMGYLL